MYLKSLELQGFKSFPDKTKLTFESGATIIVGPNGSGKSNISDAMRWVLGEISSKSIRGNKMEDIIFGGSESRKPMGYAEVSVTFDNRDQLNRLECPYDEVTVTRRYYRSGDSEYYINRQAVRLKDIYELFMNTGIGRDGYSIVGQGKIAEIISRKSDERRSIFEDASGIAKYRHKKNETENKLAATEDNMTRIRDVFLEVEAQVGPLEKEAERAERAIELLETKKRVDVQLWLFDTDKLRTELNEAEENYNRSQFELNSANDIIASFEAQNDKLFEESQSNKMQSELLLTQINQQNEMNHELESQFLVAQKDIQHAKEQIVSDENAAEQWRQTLKKQDDDHAERAAKLSKLNEEKESIQKERQDAIDRRQEVDTLAGDLEDKIAKAFDDLENLKAERERITIRLSVIENTRITDTDKNSSILEELHKYEAVSADLGEKKKKSQSTIDGYDASIKELTKEIEELGKQLEKLYEERRLNEEKIKSLDLKKASLTQRIETYRAMEEQYDGYSGSVRFVMKAYSEGRITARGGKPCGTIYGPLSKVISVEDKYVTAVETALGANLQHIVVDNEETAKAAMFALKKENAGRATFFPVTSMQFQSVTREMEDAKKYPGFVAYAEEVVKRDKIFDPVVSALIGRTVIFDTIENATEMARDERYHIHVVTLDGQQIRVGGSFTGGSVKNGGGMLSRVGEIKRLEEKCAETEEEIRVSAEEGRKLETAISEAEENSSSREDKRRLLDVMKSGETASLDKIVAQLDANNSLWERMKNDYGSVIEQNKKYEEEYAELSREAKELDNRIKEIGEFRESKNVERGELLEESEKLGVKITELYIRLSETQKDIETETLLDAGVLERAENCRRQIEQLESRMDECRRKVEDFTKAQAENRDRHEKGEKRLEELNQKRSLLENDNFEFEKKLGAINQKLREKRSEQENLIKEFTRNENKLNAIKSEQDKLATKLWDDYEMTRAEAQALGYPPITQVTRAAVAAKQIECRNKLRAIGNVDLDAVNKYREVKERYDYMDRQIKDLNASREELLKIINQLEGEMKTAFVESFNRINENFGKTFSELFGGGTAEISLTEPDDVLNSGIEIKAAPPGKIIKSLMQLSGGEQAFVAIALLFAILNVNPPPFCIMDEIEAALDEVNVARLAEYIKRYSDDTQFIMITHRRGTMEAANRLYGVTMPEHGISKVLALDVAEIAKKKGDDWDGIFG